MDPPTLSRQPTIFWGALKKAIQADAENNLAWVYFKTNGWGSNVPLVQPREVGWTLDDFVSFYDCPETERSWAKYVNFHLSRSYQTNFPTWPEVVDAMNNLFASPAHIPDLLGLRAEVNRTGWGPMNHVLEFVLTLLNYRYITVEGGTPASRDDFQTRQATYASSFGSKNPFYLPWDSSDKWVAAYLLYAKLAFEQQRYEANNTNINYNNNDDDKQHVEIEEKIAQPVLEQELVQPAVENQAQPVVENQAQAAVEKQPQSVIKKPARSVSEKKARADKDVKFEIEEIRSAPFQETVSRIRAENVNDWNTERLGSKNQLLHSWLPSLGFW
ncbi:hypothetical protein F4804DRAFT_332124 [Jackrogersella minutella]|nr:hypothetical protein F4804DRAFT_332124 [Jackrogersella minutella]